MSNFATFIEEDEEEEAEDEDDKSIDASIKQRISDLPIKKGTVIDTKIRHPTDFYLCSHVGIQLGSTKKDLFRSCMDKGKKQDAPSKSKMIEQPLKTCMKNANNKDPKKPPSSSKDHASPRKSHRKEENPVRIPAMDQFLEFGNSNAWICKNTACKAKLSMDDAFCKRCSCCICLMFDDNKDPSLWLVCSSESSGDEYCCLSCHIECALRFEKVGVVNLRKIDAA